MTHTSKKQNYITNRWLCCIEAPFSRLFTTGNIFGTKLHKHSLNTLGFFLPRRLISLLAHFDASGKVEGGIIFCQSEKPSCSSLLLWVRRMFVLWCLSSCTWNTLISRSGTFRLHVGERSSKRSLVGTGGAPDDPAPSSPPRFSILTVQQQFWQAALHCRALLVPVFLLDCRGSFALWLLWDSLHYTATLFPQKCPLKKDYRLSYFVVLQNAALSSSLVPQLRLVNPITAGAWLLIVKRKWV